MKCSNCGSNNLKEVEFPVMVLYDSGEVNKDIVTYICLDCGHYEFFNVKVAQTLKKQKDEQDKIENQVDNLLKEIDKLEYEYKKTINSVLISRDELLKKTANLDITVREKLKLDEDIKAIDDKLVCYKNEYLDKVYRINQDIKKIKEQKPNYNKLVG